MKMQPAGRFEEGRSWRSNALITKDNLMFAAFIPFGGYDIKPMWFLSMWFASNLL